MENVFKCDKYKTRNDDIRHKQNSIKMLLKPFSVYLHRQCAYSYSFSSSLEENNIFKLHVSLQLCLSLTNVFASDVCGDTL